MSLIIPSSSRPLAIRILAVVGLVLAPAPAFPSEKIKAALGIPDRELTGRWRPSDDITVDTSSVESYLKLAPLFLALEREQFEILEEIKRTRHAGKKRRLTHEMTEILRRAERYAGMTHVDFRELKRRIRTVHRALYYQRAAEKDYRRLLAAWDREAEAGRANHEFFSRAKERLKAVRERSRREYTSFALVARSAVETYDDHIVDSFKDRRRQETENVGVRTEDLDGTGRTKSEAARDARGYWVDPEKRLQRQVAERFPRRNNPMFQRLPGDQRAPQLTEDDFSDNYPIRCSRCPE